MTIRDSWDRMDIPAFVAAWLEEERNGGGEGDDSLAMKATPMSFTASSEVQWCFVCSAVEQSRNDDELGTIAAGPFESLMGKSGRDFIDRLEGLCRSNPKFAKMTTGAWQHTMDAQVWERVKAIQAGAANLGE